MIGAVLHFSPETRDPILPLFGINGSELVDLAVSATDGEGLRVLFTGSDHSTLEGGREGGEGEKGQEGGRDRRREGEGERERERWREREREKDREQHINSESLGEHIRVCRHYLLGMHYS